MFWQLIRTPIDALAPMSYPAVAEINEYEVAILGGWSNTDFKRHGDVILFDSRNQ